MTLHELHQDIQTLIDSKKDLSLVAWMSKLDSISNLILALKDETTDDMQLIELSKYELLLDFLRSKV
jgi:hypothetical protein